MISKHIFLGRYLRIEYGDNMVRIVVFGGAGFLGQYVVNKLINEGHEVLVFDSKVSPHMDASSFINVYEYLKNIKPFIIVNLAGLTGALGRGGNTESVKHPYQFIYVNTVIVLNILESMRLLGIKYLIQMSSLAPFGDKKEIDENTTYEPKTPYGLSKMFIEYLCKLYAELYGLKILIIRAPLIAGKGQKELNALREFIITAIKDRTIIVYGNGKHVREWIHPSDVSEAISLSINYIMSMDKKYDILLISNPNNRISMIDLAKIVARIVNDKLGINAIIKFINYNKTYGNQTVNIENTSKKLSWRPRIKLIEIINEIIGKDS